MHSRVVLNTGRISQASSHFLSMKYQWHREQEPRAVQPTASSFTDQAGASGAIGTTGSLILDVQSMVRTWPTHTTRFRGWHVTMGMHSDIHIWLGLCCWPTELLPGTMLTEDAHAHSSLLEFPVLSKDYDHCWITTQPSTCGDIPGKAE